MDPCRSLGLLAGSLGLASVLVALSTDFWFVAMGPKSSAHSGLWPKGNEHFIKGKEEWYLLGGELPEGTGPQKSYL